MLRHGPRFHQAFITNHANGEADVRQLYQNQTDPEVIADFVITNNRRANHRQPGAQGVAPAQPALTQQIVNQRNVQRREDSKQQEFRDRQVEIRLKAEQVHNAKLHRAHQHIEANGFQVVPARAQER
ncbi:FIG00639319: hypothetical protein [Kosakonia radicincitans]|nr:FIG00639319: hypothetical protein [Kosakonia radicincitans]